jgi:hypothetical protein
MNPVLLQAVSGAVLWTWKRSHAAKTYEYFLSTLEHLIESVYSGNLGGEFNSIMDNLILGQISQAFETAWVNDGNELPPPEYLRDPAQELIREQQGYVKDFYRAIVDARVDGTPIDPLLARAELWAGQYNGAHAEAVRLITAENGGKLVWKLGATEQHCATCAALNGITAYARDWDELGVHPQQPENKLLECGGWRCDCSLEPTTRRKTPKAYEAILNAVSVGGM